MIDRSRRSGGVFWAAAKPLGPTGRTRVPSHGGAAVACPMRVGAGLGDSTRVADDAVAAGWGGDVPAGTPEQPHTTDPRTPATRRRPNREARIGTPSERRRNDRRGPMTRASKMVIVYGLAVVAFLAGYGGGSLVLSRLVHLQDRKSVV